MLGTTVVITISAATADALTGTVPAGLIPGVWALTVRNPDGQSDTLSPAYTALNPPSPDTTLETGYVSTFGSAAPGAFGDDDHVQVIFFEVPDGTPGNLFIRVFDADTGGALDELYGGGGTTISYTLRGGSGAYSVQDARSSHPGPAGINSGTLLTQTVIGADAAYDSNWGLVFGPHSAGEGELVGSRRVFKLAVEGASGNDGDLYNVALSTDPLANTAPAGSRVFAYSWTFPLASGSPQWLYPYVPTGTSTFDQHNWDMDNPPGTMMLHTPVRDFVVPDSGISGDSTEANSPHSVASEENGATWTVTMNFSFAGLNDLTFWVENGAGADLAIFTRPTTAPPP
jgi:hypothetical protein